MPNESKSFVMPNYIYIYIYIYIICTEILLPGEGSRSCLLPNSFNGTSLAVSQWKLRMDTYGWVSIQPSQPKQAIMRTGFDFNVFFSGVLQFQLVRSLRAIGLNALNLLSTVIYINCAIKQLYLLRQCDFDNLTNKQF